ncbi:MAG: GNAT family N-acetyltransferase [Nocardioidaceae bacterium]
MTKQLTAADIPLVASVWSGANDRRRADLGLEQIEHPDTAANRTGSFGVGLFEQDRLLAMAVAMPALADDARSSRRVPGLAHISSVATEVGSWGHGYAGQVVRAVMSQAVRRGFARTQLWTHASNAGARRVYLREGFELSGRDRLDDHGEAIVHFVRELPAPEVLGRRAARVVCVDPDDRILLMHWRDVLDGHQLWEPPGGGIEPGETSYDAVRREWAEETGLPLPTLRPKPEPVARDAIWRGARLVTTEDFYLGRTDTRAARLDVGGFMAEEQADSMGYAWMHWSDLEGSEDPVEPDVLAVLRRLDAAGPWTQ